MAPPISTRNRLRRALRTDGSSGVFMGSVSRVRGPTASSPGGPRFASWSNNVSVRDAASQSARGRNRPESASGKISIGTYTSPFTMRAGPGIRSATPSTTT